MAGYSNLADLPVNLDESSETPLNRQVYRGLRDAILRGDLAPGTRLPPRAPRGTASRVREHLSRLVDPLSGSTNWVEYEGTSVVRRIWDGRANLGELDVSGPSGRIEGLSLRLYSPETMTGKSDRAAARGFGLGDQLRRRSSRAYRPWLRHDDHGEGRR